MKILIFNLVVLTIFSLGCNEDQKIDKEQVAHLYVDILITNETYKHDKDSLNFITDSLYNYYDISQDQYKGEIEKFQFNEETWSDFFKLAEEYLDTLKAIEDRRIAEAKENEIVNEE
ncbi:MAG: hypothetical protein ABFS12_11240 [Bacteroidota bacterium]